MNFSSTQKTPQTIDQTTLASQRRLPFSRVFLWALGCIAFTGWVNANTGNATGAQIYLASKSVSGVSNQAGGPIVAGTVDLNTATAEEMAAALKGVGLSKAKAIVRYRTEIGPFRDVQELEEVKGIGPRTVARNKNRITLSKAKR
jgi:competence ComEA-like helix-hairpin-helix protein